MPAPSLPSAPTVPPRLLAVLEAVRRIGRPLLVGGCVRDWLRGREAKDFDVEVYGVSAEALASLLARFGSTDPVGRSFGVLKLRVDGLDYDFSLPRREIKTAEGHRGFAVGVDPFLNPAEALARRDFTINAMAFDPFSHELVDPHGGADDLAARRLRHTSPAFVEDPLRVLRAMQFAARFDFTLVPETAALSRSIAPTFSELPVERVWGEWEKWASRSVRPSAGLRVLADTGWLVHFPELAALAGVPQEPEWHPEGDVFVHTGHCVDALARLTGWQALTDPVRRDVMFAVLAHDFGKPATTARAEKHGKERWVSPGHEMAGGPLAERFLNRLGAPKAAIPFVRALVEHHFAHLAWETTSRPSEAYVRRLARRLEPATIEYLLLVLRADHLGRPPKVCPQTAGRIEQLATAARALALEVSAPRPLLLGRHLIAAGLPPGPQFRSLLDTAFEAQLDGAFTDETGAVAWLRTHFSASIPGS